MIPEVDLVPKYDEYHVGRGGAGNEHHEDHSKSQHQDGHTEGLADKLKHKIVGNK